MKEVGDEVDKLGEGDVLPLATSQRKWLLAPSTRDDNAHSRQQRRRLMLLIRYVKRRLLLTEIEKQGEAAAVEEGVDLRSDLVKVAHHAAGPLSTERLRRSGAASTGQ